MEINMIVKKYIRGIIRSMRHAQFRLKNLRKEKFECPICRYVGPFKDIKPLTGLRKHAQCPKCSALERHRMQYIVVDNILKDINSTKLKALHFAPEAFFKKYFAEQFGEYETADLYVEGVDHKVDLINLPFPDKSYDFVFASHVLEHISDDKKAISEIRRILKTNGIAILPVPIVAETTIEYPTPNPNESFHVRAPGYDYYERYNRYFSRVDKVMSDSLPDKYQLHTFEDRTFLPSVESPLRPAMSGEKHIDIVPICYV